MQQENKNQKISRLAARTGVKVFIILVVAGLVPLLSGEGAWGERLKKAHLVVPNKWTLVFPALLFLGFLSLLIVCLRQKYRQTDFNWLLVLNTLILLIYLALIYIQLYKVAIG